MKVCWEIKYSFRLQVPPHELHTNCKGEKVPVCMERSGSHQLTKMISVSFGTSRRAHHHISSDVSQQEKKIPSDLGDRS